jgi:hypothetical protein
MAAASCGLLQTACNTTITWLMHGLGRVVYSAMAEQYYCWVALSASLASRDPDRMVLSSGLSTQKMKWRQLAGDCATDTTDKKHWFPASLKVQVIANARSQSLKACHAATQHPWL